MAVDSAGNVYVAGSAGSSDFPTTVGAFQATAPGGTGGHAFVAKLNPTGSALVYATYLGGTTAGIQGFPESASTLTIDASGNAIVAGQTSFTDFPTTTSAFQPTSNGCGSAPASFANFCKGFVTKLNSTGSALIYSTYLGGTAPDTISGVAGDANGMIYVTGSTFSSDFPTTPGALKTVFNPGGPRFFQSNAFVTKFDPSQAGTASLVDSTYLGGANARGNAITVDSTGNAYITGPSNGDFPVTPGAVHATGSAAFFVAKLNPAGSALVWGAMVGGQTADFTSANAIALDAAGNTYITGTTTDPTFAITPGAFLTAIPLGGPAFVTKLNAAGTALVYSTFLGGNTAFGLSESGIGNSIAVDSAGNAFVTGVTSANDFPLTAVTLDPVCAANANCLFSTNSNFPTIDNAFVTELNPSGSALVFSTYLGGSTRDRGNAITVDGTGNIYVGGSTLSCDFPTTPGAFQTSSTRCQQGFVSKISVTAAGSAAALLPGTVKFPAEGIGTAAPPQTAILTNRGNADLAISNIAFTNGGVFTENNNCGVTLAPAASCTFTFGFTPNATSTFTGQVSVTDNAVGSPHIVNLTGAGGTPAATLSGTSLTFANQVLNTTSASQSITLTNGGTADFKVTNVTTTGDFAQTNTCGGFVTAGTNCAVSVTFKPTTIGARSGSVTITDNAASSPQTILLGGTGNDFTLSATSTSATISAGQSANYTLNIAPAGTFTQPITLACTGAPAGASCSVSPNSLTPSGTTALTATVTVTTTARGQTVPVSWSPRLGPPVLLAFATIGLLFLLLRQVRLEGARHALRPRLLLPAALLLILGIASCGGGSNGGGGGGGTPPGTYNLTVTATSGTGSKTMALTLNVN